MWHSVARYYISFTSDVKETKPEVQKCLVFSSQTTHVCGVKLFIAGK